MSDSLHMNLRFLILVLQAIATVLPSFGQNSTPSMSDLRLCLRADHQELVSARQPENYTDDYLYRRIHSGGLDRCERFKKKKIAGIILTTAGGGLFAMGVILTDIGATDAGIINRNNVYNVNGPQTPIPTRDVVLESVGIPSIILGLGAFCTGIPLAVQGANGYRRNCRRHRDDDNYKSYLEINSDRNGIGIAYNF